MTNTTAHQVTLLTRAGCALCDQAWEQVTAICAELGAAAAMVDVDAVAGEDPRLRAEYGDRLPVVLLDGREHSYFDVDETRLRADLSG